MNLQKFGGLALAALMIVSTATIGLLAPGVLTAQTNHQMTTETPEMPAPGVSCEAGIGINAGGDNVTVANETYLGDRPFMAGNGNTYSVSEEFNNTTDDELYRTERYGDFAYHLPAVNGEYRVTLLFAEIYQGVNDNDDDQVGDRLFNVSIENETVLSDYDIYAEVGALNATQKTYVANVTDGTLDIEFETVRDNAKVNAVLVEPLCGDVVDDGDETEENGTEGNETDENETDTGDDPENPDGDQGSDGDHDNDGDEPVDGDNGKVHDGDNGKVHDGDDETDGANDDTDDDTDDEDDTGDNGKAHDGNGKAKVA